MRPDVEKIWGTIKKGLQDGAAVAISKAEGLTQLGRARLDIAEVKTRLFRLKVELGDEVYQRVQAGQSSIADNKIVKQLCSSLKLMHQLRYELLQVLQTYGLLQHSLQHL